MRLYLKLALIVAAAAVTQLSVRPANQAAWEVHFAARCWVAHHLQDERLQEQLVREGQQRLQDKVERVIEAEPQRTTVNASVGR